MNEKILKLADKVGINYATGFGYSNDKVSDLQLEEFAELIVKECANIAADQSAIRPEYRIRKHFGVEE